MKIRLDKYTICGIILIVYCFNTIKQNVVGKGIDMLISKLHTPEGVRDHLPDECILKRKIEKSIAKVFECCGYLPVTSPTFEYNDVFCGMGGVKDSRVFKFLDRDGSLLVLRPDMTPAIARIGATAYNKEDRPLKFYYIESMFRTNENYQGKLREFTQAGVEILGVNSIDADAEVVSSAINSLLAAGADNFKLDIGHAMFLKGVIEEANVDNKTAYEIQQNIIKKNYVAVNELAENIQNDNIKYILQELPLLIGDEAVIDKVKDKVTNKLSLKAIHYLMELYNILKSLGYEKYISFDLGVIGSMDYYTGLIFRGYGKGSGSSILDGGRYDNMVEKFGTEMPAVGFALKVNDLMKIMDKPQVKSADYIAVYEKDNRIEAFKMVNALREQGIRIENSFSDSVDEAIKYALDHNIPAVLSFENGSISITDVMTGDNEIVALSDILAKEESE